jgi:hypothetical protein
MTMLLATSAGPAVASIGEGALIVNARLRYEFVDQSGISKDADAVTLRTRLGYETPAIAGFKALIEAENVTALVEDFNSTTNGRTAYPVVADPQTTAINRAQISWTGRRAEAIVGRQRIVLNNARFVGNVGFRQNEQTFDAVKASVTLTPSVSVTYAWLNRIHRVFGHESAQGEWRSDSHLIQADAKTPLGQVSAYGYLLDFANAPTQSGATWGVRFVGAHKLEGPLSATYELEYARQTDYGDNPARFDLDYVAVYAGLKDKTRAVAFGVERLGGDGAHGFQTPLATLHTFHGWADLFLTTPAAGVRDVNVSASAVFAAASEWPVKAQLALHQFDDADGGRSFGKEVDAALSAPLSDHLSAEIAAAAFVGGDPTFADRTKLWVTLDYKY